MRDWQNFVDLRSDRFGEKLKPFAGRRFTSARKIQIQKCVKEIQRERGGDHLVAGRNEPLIPIQERLGKEQGEECTQDQKRPERNVLVTLEESKSH